MMPTKPQQEYDAEYHANLLSRQYRLNRRQSMFMQRGMAHALQRVHDYRSKAEAVDDIRRAMLPTGIGGFVIASFFSGLISWIAHRIADYIWENWRASEEHPTQVQALQQAIAARGGPNPVRK